MTRWRKPSPSLTPVRRYLREYRESKNIGQRAAAGRMGAAPTYVADLENGATRDPGLNTVAKWAYALGLDLHVVLVDPVTNSKRGFVVPPIFRGEQPRSPEDEL